MSEEKHSIEPGCCVKIRLAEKDGPAERLWVQVTEVGPLIKGKIDNQPVDLQSWKFGDVVEFHRSEIIEVIQ